MLAFEPVDSGSTWQHLEFQHETLFLLGDPKLKRIPVKMNAEERLPFLRLDRTSGFPFVFVGYLNDV